MQAVHVLILLINFLLCAPLHHPKPSKVAQKFRLFTYKEGYEHVVDRIRRLKEVRELQQLQIFATEVALVRAQQELQNLDSTGGNTTYKTLRFDYGYTSRSSGSSRPAKESIRTSSVPANAFVLAGDNFRRELTYLLKGSQEDTAIVKGNDISSTDYWERQRVRKLVGQLTLSNDNIWSRENQRPPVQAPWIIKAPYYLLCLLLDNLFSSDRPIERFYFLETVARMPYFSYITMLHTYETLGWWRRSAEAKRVHFAEEYNEYHHLLIWESLGGDQRWRTRFLAQHSAIIYFFVLILLWIISPTLAYNFSELIEAHAVDTYSEFAEANRDILMSLPPPTIAIDYYEAPDLYVFDEFQTSKMVSTSTDDSSSLQDKVTSVNKQQESTATTSPTPQQNSRLDDSNTKLFAADETFLLSIEAQQYLLHDWHVEDGLEVGAKAQTERWQGESSRKLSRPSSDKEIIDADDSSMAIDFNTTYTSLQAKKTPPSVPHLSERRRPHIRTLYDAVCAIRDDEAAHVMTMRQCQDPQVLVRSPNTERALFAVSLASAAVLAASNGYFDDIQELFATSSSTASSTASTTNALVDAVSDSVRATSDTIVEQTRSSEAEEMLRDVVDNVADKEIPQLLLEFVTRLIKSFRP